MTCEINGREYSKLVVKLTRKFNIVNSGNGGTTISNRDIIDPIGTKYSYTLTIDSMYKDQKLLENFWNDISTPRADGIRCKLPYNQSTIEFYAHITSGNQELLHSYNGQNTWGLIDVELIPIQPQTTEVF